jgi:putative phage-type endonuclease
MSTVETTDAAAWHEWRARGLGGSDIAAVLGVSPWASRYSVWAEKVGLVQRDPSDTTEAQEFGHRAEPMLAQWFHDKTGLYVLGQQQQVEHPVYPWRRCTLDGFVGESPDTPIGKSLGPYEAKTTPDSPAAWEAAVPVYYQCQATWLMLVTETEHCWFSVLHHGFANIHRWYEFHLDDADAAYVRAETDRFWYEHVLTGIPPTVDGSEATTDALAGMWSETIEGASVPADDELLRLLAERDQWKQTAEMAEAALDRIDNEVRLAIGENEVLVGPDGKKLSSWKWQTAHRLDSKALKAEHPELAEQYMTESRSRVLRYTKEKEPK